jgi:hypothetical protein
MNAGAIPPPLAGGPLLLDERASPPLREVIGALLASAREACFAVARVRLAGIDLSASELAGVRRCRVLLGRLDADVLADAEAAARRGELRRNLQVLAAFLASGRVEVRAAGLEAWVPDFSVFMGLPADAVPGGCAAIVGGHYFHRPFPVTGPSLTCVIPGGAAARRAARRFEELWAAAHDVLPVVEDAIARALREVGPGEPVDRIRCRIEGVAPPAGTPGHRGVQPSAARARTPALAGGVAPRGGGATARSALRPAADPSPGDKDWPRPVFELADFQRDAVRRASRILAVRRGVLIADSVGRRWSTTPCRTCTSSSDCSPATETSGTSAWRTSARRSGRRLPTPRRRAP